MQRFVSSEVTEFIILCASDNILSKRTVFEWLVDEDNRELATKIEEVNSPMLENILNTAVVMAVLFTSKVPPFFDPRSGVLESSLDPSS